MNKGKQNTKEITNGKKQTRFARDIVVFVIGVLFGILLMAAIGISQIENLLTELV